MFAGRNGRNKKKHINVLFLIPDYPSALEPVPKIITNIIAIKKAVYNKQVLNLTRWTLYIRRTLQSMQDDNRASEWPDSNLRKPEEPDSETSRCRIATEEQRSKIPIWGVTLEGGTQRNFWPSQRVHSMILHFITWENMLTKLIFWKFIWLTK